MTPLAVELQVLKKTFEGQGVCRLASLGDACRCPLCVLDEATMILERMKHAFEKGMISRELDEYLREKK